MEEKAPLKPKQNQPDSETFAGSAWLIALITAILILPGLGAPNLSIDEPTTIDLLERANIYGSLSVAVAAHLDGYLFVVIHFLAEILLGNNIFALRFPSAIAAIFSAVILFHLLRIFFPERKAFWYTAFFTLSPIALYYAKEARAYSFTVLFFFLFLYCYFSTAIRKKWQKLFATTFAACLLVLVHNIGIFYLAAFFLSMGLYRLLKKRIMKFKWDFIFGFLCFSATLPIVLNRFLELRDIPQSYMVHVNISLARVLAEEFIFTNPNSFTGSNIISGSILAGVFMPLALFLWKRKMRPVKLGFLLFWVMPPLLAQVLELMLQRKMLYYPRAYFATLPFVLIFIVENALIAFPGFLKTLYLVTLASIMAFSSAKILLEIHPEYRSRDNLLSIVTNVEHASAGRKVFVHLFAMAPYFKANFKSPEKVSALGRSNPDQPFDEKLINSIREIETIPGDMAFTLVTNRLAESFNDPEHKIEKIALMSRKPVADFTCGTGSLKIFCDRILVFDIQQSNTVNLVISGQYASKDSPIVLRDEFSEKECILTSMRISACGPFGKGNKFKLAVLHVRAGTQCEIANPEGVISADKPTEIQLQCLTQ